MEHEASNHAEQMPSGHVGPRRSTLEFIRQMARAYRNPLANMAMPGLILN